MQGGEEARSETYLDVRCNDERRSQRRRWAFFSSLLGYSRQGYPLHVVCGQTPSGTLRLITVYIPSPPKWVDERTRRT